MKYSVLCSTNACLHFEIIEETNEERKKTNKERNHGNVVDSLRPLLGKNSGRTVVHPF